MTQVQSGQLYLSVFHLSHVKNENYVLRSLWSVFIAFFSSLHSAFYDNKDESFSFARQFSPFSSVDFITFIHKICDLQVVYHTFIAPQTMKWLQSREGKLSAMSFKWRLKWMNLQEGYDELYGLDEKGSRFSAWVDNGQLDVKCSNIGWMSKKGNGLT